MLTAGSNPNLDGVLNLQGGEYAGEHLAGEGNEVQPDNCRGQSHIALHQTPETRRPGEEALHHIHHCRIHAGSAPANRVTFIASASYMSRRKTPEA